MKTIITLLLAGALTACGSQSSQSQPLSAASTKLENEDLSDSLTGIDANGDGVRDDIEAHLKKRLADKPDVLYWALEFAKSQAATVLATNRQQAIESGLQVTQTMGCLVATFAKDDGWILLSRDITAFSFNTEPRLQAYRASWKLRSGGSFSGDKSLCKANVK